MHSHRQYNFELVNTHSPIKNTLIPTLFLALWEPLQ